MPRTKVAMIGSGSFGFTSKLARDLLTFPAFADCEIALMDVDAENLELSRRGVARIVEAGGYPAIVTATTDRKAALRGADGVICTIECSDDATTASDVNVPLKYGISVNVGDTRGPSAIFRFLRTWPFMREIAADIEALCPKAIFLNYTNPMAMLCRAMQGTFGIRVTGLCHSVQGTARMLADWIGAPIGEIAYRCAGINHQAWYLDFLWNGEDAYPLIRKALEDPEIANREQVRNDMFRHLGYYVTESSGHNSEYVAWYRKRQDLRDKYCETGTGWNPGRQRAFRPKAVRDEARRKSFSDFAGGEVDLNRSEEFATYIFNAVFGDNGLFEFNGNVRNFGLIENLPYGACVEVPALASKFGIKPFGVGRLPAQLALLNSISSQAEELAVEGALRGDRDAVYYAAYYDPLSSAVLSLAEIRAMIDEMFAAHEGWLPMFATK